MSDDRANFLEYVFTRYVAGRVRGAHIRTFGDPFRRETEARLDSLIDAARLIRSGEQMDEGEFYATFRLDALARTVYRAESGVDLARALAAEAGVLDALDEHLLDIIDGLDVSQLPVEDRRFFADVGSPDPESELRGLVYLLRLRRDEIERASHEQRLEGSLRQLSTQLDRLGDQLKSLGERADQEPDEKARPRRRAWTGIGHVVEGAALLIVNIWVAAGQIPGLTADTKVAGSLASAATGVGSIFVGVGDLRGE